MIKYCPNCRTKVEEGFKYCPSCSNKIDFNITTNVSTNITSNSNIPNEKKSNIGKILIVLTLIFITIAITATVYVYVSGFNYESDVIHITIDSTYSYDAGGYLTVDDIRFQEFYIFSGNTATYEVDKSKLPEKTYHTVILYAESGSVEQSDTCNLVQNSVKFEVINFMGSHDVKCIDYE